VSLLETRNVSLALPKGYAAIPISKDQERASLKICVLVRPEADPVGGHLVLLRDTFDTKVYLGCVTDACGQVHEWLELWIQNSQGILNTPIAHREPLSNTVLDDRWIRKFRAFAELSQENVVKTGWESRHPLPTLLDLASASPIHPVETNSQSPWQLCTDDGLLRQKQLPAYGGSLHRYLHVPALGLGSRFIPVTPDAPTNESTGRVPEICGDPTRNIPLNLESGLIMVRRHLPIGLEVFIDVLSGALWDGLKHGRSELNLGTQTAELKGRNDVSAEDGRLFLESEGKSGRLLETFYLKLRLLSDIVSSVQLLVLHLQRPLLNINADSFRVRLGQAARGLPFLWTAKAELCDPGDAISLTVENTDEHYYVSSSAGVTSVYRPLDVSLSTSGQASIRITQVSTNPDKLTVAEGTFATQEQLRLASHDLVWLRLTLASGSINLYAHLQKDSAIAPGEWCFHTVGQNVGTPDLASLQAAKGVPIHRTPFEVIPLLSSPCDLYSLAVLAARIMLVDNRIKLPFALDAMLSLARKVEASYDTSVEMSERIGKIFAADKRWLPILGPHHLLFDDISPDEALRLFPGRLWWTTLGVIVRMFPGLGPDSVCRDYGDAPQQGLHRTFDQTNADLEDLLLRARSLIVPDWQSNCEITGIIRQYLQKYPKQDQTKGVK